VKPRHDDFFAYARERHSIYLKRAAGEPRPWSDDPVFTGGSRFTNVFRELDKTTVWYRENVRERYDEIPDVLLATVIFRMFNRIEVGEALFSQLNINGMTAFDWYRVTGDKRVLRQAIKCYVTGPVTTGAYIISSPPGYSKLDGVLWIIDQFCKRRSGGLTWRDMAEACTVGPMPLETVFNWLKEFPYLGKFHSYEIVTDLRHTYLLNGAPDIMTWCNIGPGAVRGLARIHGRPISEGGKIDGGRVPVQQMLDEMRHLLALSRGKVFWPSDWPAWEMRDVEHTLCEFDKYNRVKEGQGRTRGVFR
jgi:hypothetical protein